MRRPQSYNCLLITAAMLAAVAAPMNAQDRDRTKDERDAVILALGGLAMGLAMLGDGGGQGMDFAAIDVPAGRMPTLLDFGTLEPTAGGSGAIGLFGPPRVTSHQNSGSPSMGRTAPILQNGTTEDFSRFDGGSGSNDAMGGESSIIAPEPGALAAFTCGALPLLVLARKWRRAI